MNLCYFQEFWDIVGLQVTSECLDALNNCCLPAEMNSTHIVLIPKKDRPQRVGHLRPISLCNVIYKIVAKVLANRLKRILPLVISEYQSAFILGRLITDNVAFETCHYLKR